MGAQRDSPPHPPARAARRHRGREAGSPPGPAGAGPRPYGSPGSAVRLSGPGRAGALRRLSMCRGSRISGRVRDGIWGGRGGAGGEPRGGASAPRGAGAVSPCSGESWGLLAELGGGGTSGTSAGDDTVPAPPQHCCCRTRPRCHTPQGCWCRRGQGSWQGVGSAPGTEWSHVPFSPTPLAMRPGGEVARSWQELPTVPWPSGWTWLGPTRCFTSPDVLQRFPRAVIPPALNQWSGAAAGMAAALLTVHRGSLPCG